MSLPWAIACCWLLCRKLWKHKDPASTWAVPTSPLELEHLHFSQNSGLITIFFFLEFS